MEGGLTLPPEAPPAAVHSSEDGVIGVFDHIPVPVPVEEEPVEEDMAGEDIAAAGVVSTGGAGGGTTGSIGNPKGATLTPLGAPDSFS